MKQSAICAGYAVVLYSVGAFVAVSFNPADWIGEGRALLAGAWLCASALTILHGMIEQ